MYRPAYCDAVAAFRTINAFGRHIGVSTRTLCRWIQTYPEFADATRAMTRRHLGLLYRDDYCEAVAGFHTLTAFARHIGVSRGALYLWIKTYPDFAEATKTMTRQHPNLLYRDAYCDEVVDFLKDGHSLAAFAGHIGVSPDTLYEWMKTHPEFAEAVKRAKAKSILWWERRLLDLAQTGQGNAAAITFGLKNRAPQEWRDKTHTELSGTVERIHRVERVIVRPEPLAPAIGMSAIGAGGMSEIG